MHRIVEVCDDHYVIVGDNLIKKEYVTDDMICGVLVGFYKDGKNISIAKTLRYISFIPRFGLLFCLFALLFFFSQEGLIGLKGIFSKRGDVYLWLKIRKKDKNVLKWMFTVCKKQVPLMILLVVLNAIYGVSSVFAKFSKNIIDGATQAKDFNIVIKFALCMLGLVVFQMALNITKNSLSERCSARLEMILKSIFLIW